MSYKIKIHTSLQFRQFCSMPTAPTLLHQLTRILFVITCVERHHKVIFYMSKKFIEVFHVNTIAVLFTLLMLHG